MRHRGSQYWAWSDCRLPILSHDEALSNGMQLSVQARVSRNGVTQAFIGIYEDAGEMMVEEYYDSLFDETISQALAKGFIELEHLLLFLRQLWKSGVHAAVHNSNCHRQAYATSQLLTLGFTDAGGQFSGPSRHGR